MADSTGKNNSGNTTPVAQGILPDQLKVITQLFPRTIRPVIGPPRVEYPTPYVRFYRACAGKKPYFILGGKATDKSGLAGKTPQVHVYEDTPALEGTSHFKDVSDWLGCSPRVETAVSVVAPSATPQSATTFAHTTVYLSRFHKHLKRHIANNSYTHVRGWCPWVTHKSILKALNSKDALLVVRSDQRNKLLKWSRVHVRYWPVPDLRFKSDGREEPQPTLHGKVMVFGTLRPGSATEFEPAAVWRGSCNWTGFGFHANEAEEASFSVDPAMARLYHDKFAELWAKYDPLNTTPTTTTTPTAPRKRKSEGDKYAEGKEKTQDNVAEDDPKEKPKRNKADQ